ncbi:hypothetical protein BD309DRAFT_141884 [Dichomitus squalens]|nr:hypothetical protein BD309DRAFT_141884 [Dichomitus squalens]
MTSSSSVTSSTRTRPTYIIRHPPHIRIMSMFLCSTFTAATSLASPISWRSPAVHSSDDRTDGRSVGNPVRKLFGLPTICGLAWLTSIGGDRTAALARLNSGPYFRRNTAFFFQPQVAAEETAFRALFQPRASGSKLEWMRWSGGKSLFSGDTAVAIC